MDHDVLQYLITPETVDHFKEDLWGKKPFVSKGTRGRAKLFRDLFDIKKFREIVRHSKLGDLEFNVDIITARYKNGVRERPIVPICNEEGIQKLFNEGSTIQFLQPQRFVPELRDICVELESQFECLVGCNAYITPKNTQGLAPHHDDVELFICQTQGTKDWKIYRPLNGFVLPNGPSEDLSQEVIGEPVLEVTLNVGDVLYLPKGTVHQAMAQNEHCVHLTVSTYQRWTWADLTEALTKESILAASEPVCFPESMREELPLGFLSQIGQYTGTNEKAKDMAKQLAKRLRDLADAVENKPEMVQRATDLMSFDFMISRMPPNEDQIPQQDDPPRLNDRIQLIGKNFSRMLPVRRENGSIDDSAVQIVTCLDNDPCSHMMDFPEESSDDMEIDQIIPPTTKPINVPAEKNVSDPPLSEEMEEKTEDGVLFPMKFKDALLQIYNDTNTPIRVGDLNLSNDSERLELSSMLWESNIVKIV